MSRGHFTDIIGIAHAWYFTFLASLTSNKGLVIRVNVKLSWIVPVSDLIVRNFVTGTFLLLKLHKNKFRLHGI